MRVVIPPVLVGLRLCRVVSPVESILVVEEWVEDWWEPSSVTLTAVSLAPLASTPLLAALGVPRSDHGGYGPRVSSQEIQLLMMAPTNSSRMTVSDADLQQGAHLTPAPRSEQPQRHA